MFPLSDRTESDCDGYFESQTESFDESVGWNDGQPEFDRCIKDQALNPKKIQLANQRLSLKQVLKDRGIQLPAPSFGSWSKRTCPFPSHEDHTPSFGYNVEADCFNCFGCQRGGRAVQFIAYMDGKKVIDVAEQILKGEFAKDDNLLHELIDQNKQQIEKILFEYASFFRQFILSNPNALKFAESTTWILDVFLRKSYPNSIIIEDLEEIINKIKTRFKDYHE